MMDFAKMLSFPACFSLSHGQGGHIQSLKASAEHVTHTKKQME